MIFRLSIVALVCACVEPVLAVCPVNMVRVGPVCIDQYEVSAWSKRPDSAGNPRGIQFGATTDDYDARCSDNGNACSERGTKIFAVSAPGVVPAATITWFQAQQACANVGKRLPTNAEWQMAAAGTPDPGTDNGTSDCNVATQAVVATGSRASCVSNWGAFDMVGNLWEYVADWMQDNGEQSAGPTSSALYGNDAISGIDAAFPEDDGFPAAPIRGGDFKAEEGAGVFALVADFSPSNSFFDTGFRCVQ